MAHITADRVQDSSIITGIGNVTVSNTSPIGYRTLSAVLSVSDTFFYCIQHRSQDQWEVGLGTYSSLNTFARTTVIASSAGGTTKVDFAAGTKDVFITLAADKTVQQNQSGIVNLPTNSTISGVAIAGLVSPVFTGTPAAPTAVSSTNTTQIATTAFAAPKGSISTSGLTMSTARLLGRSTASAGAVEEITLGTGLSFSGTTLNVAASSGGTVNVVDFGADPTGAVSSSTAFQNAIDSLGLLGGVVIVPPGKFLLSTSITVGDVSSPFTVSAVTLRGTYGNSGNWQQSSGSPAASTVSALRLGDSATIRLMGSCALDGVLIVRNNFTFTTGTPSFGSTSVAVNVSFSDDALVKNCAIYGFAKAITVSDVRRFKATDINIDCANGISIENSSDISYLTRVHCWPFTNHIAGTTAPPSSTTFQRSGYAFRLLGLNDWTKITDCFSYGYFRGFDMVAGDEIMLTGCGADQTPNVHTGSLGFNIAVGATNVTMNHCQAAGHQSGFYIDTGTNISTRMINCDAWGNTDNGIANVAGTLAVFGGGVRSNATGINVAGGTVYGSGVGFRLNTTNIGGTLTAMPTSYSF